MPPAVRELGLSQRLNASVPPHVGYMSSGLDSTRVSGSSIQGQAVLMIHTVGLFSDEF